jgi:hypothetical protein
MFRIHARCSEMRGSRRYMTGAGDVQGENTCLGLRSEGMWAGDHTSYQNMIRPHTSLWRGETSPNN